MNTKKLLSVLLCAALCVGILAGCGSKPSTETAAPTAAPASAAPATTAPEGPDPNTPLVVGYSPFSSKFSPFFGETAYDMDVSHDPGAPAAQRPHGCGHHPGRQRRDARI